MKKIKNYALIALIGVLFTSCIGRAIEPNIGESTLTADVDGQVWRSQDASAITFLGSFVLTANRNDGSGFSMTFLGSEPKIGVYNLPEDTQTIFGGMTYTEKDGEITYLPESGTLEITRFRDNRVVEGKFEFEGSDLNGNEVSVKNGKFDVTIAF